MIGIEIDISINSCTYLGQRDTLKWNDTESCMFQIESQKLHVVRYFHINYAQERFSTLRYQLHSSNQVSYLKAKKPFLLVWM